MDLLSWKLLDSDIFSKFKVTGLLSLIFSNCFDIYLPHVHGEKYQYKMFKLEKNLKFNNFSIYKNSMDFIIILI